MSDNETRKGDAHPEGVPRTPEAAQELLFTLLGSAIAQAQIAEGQAVTIYRLVLGREPKARTTLGVKANEVKKHLPPDLADAYDRLVQARNYLAHEVLFDCGGWTGVPGLDPPSKFADLYHAIRKSSSTISQVSKQLNQYLVDAGYPVMIAEIGPDGVRRVLPTDDGGSVSI